MAVAAAAAVGPRSRHPLVAGGRGGATRERRAGLLAFAQAGSCGGLFLAHIVRRPLACTPSCWPQPNWPPDWFGARWERKFRANRPAPESTCRPRALWAPPSVSACARCAAGRPASRASAPTRTQTQTRTQTRAQARQLAARQARRGPPRGASSPAKSKPPGERRLGELNTLPAKRLGCQTASQSWGVKLDRSLTFGQLARSCLGLDLKTSLLDCRRRRWRDWPLAWAAQASLVVGGRRRSRLAGRVSVLSARFATKAARSAALTSPLLSSSLLSSRS